MNPKINAATHAEPQTQEERDNGLHSMLKSELRTTIVDMRQARNTTLNSRALSEAITCAETAYLWLCQVNGKEGLLDF